MDAVIDHVPIQMCDVNSEQLAGLLSKKSLIYLYL